MYIILSNFGDFINHVINCHNRTGYIVHQACHFHFLISYHELAVGNEKTQQNYFKINSINTHGEFPITIGKMMP